MNFRDLFGIGADRVLSQNCCVNGTVTKTYRCWWLSVKTKPVRLYANAENTRHPHIITFTYTVDGTAHEGKLWIPYRFRPPAPGETIPVYYDPQKPERYACYALGPIIC